MKRKFNIVDYVIIFIVVLGVIGGIYFVKKKNTTFSENVVEEEITLFFHVPDIEKEILLPVKPNDKASDNRKKTDLGVVKSIELTESSAFAVGADGRSHRYTKPNYSGAKINLKLKGRVGNDGIYIGRYKYYIGDKIVLNIGKSTVFAAIVGVEK